MLQTALEKLRSHFKRSSARFRYSSFDGVFAPLSPLLFRPLWILIIVNILAIGALGVLLVLMSQEAAHLILALGITLCAGLVAMIAAYISWQAQEKGQEKNVLLQEMKHIARGLLITNERSEVVFFNKYLQPHFGNLLGQSLNSLMPRFSDESSKQTFLDLRHQALLGEVAEAEMTMQHNDETILWRIATFPLGHLKGYNAWFFDRALMGSALTRSNVFSSTSLRNFQTIFEYAPMGIVLLDPKGRILASNRFFREEIYRDLFEINDSSFYELLNVESQNDIETNLNKIMAGEPVQLPLEMEFKNHGGHNVSAFASRIQEAGSDTEGDVVTGVILHFFDNSEQKKLHLQLMQSQKMQAMGQLAGGIAHDFNNLLTAMLGFCDLLLLRHSPSDQSFTDIMQIQQNANRAANLVRQLLAFSRQQTLQPQVLDTSDILADLSVLLQRLVGVTIHLNVIHGRDVGLIKFDRGQFEQVVINLVVNARDAIEGEGTVTITTANKNYSAPTHKGHEIIPPGSYIMIEIKDTGCGISKENLPRLFDPFFTTKALGHGTGLGLSTVYGIVKQMGGFVVVESEVGKGAKFSVILPRYELASEEALPSHQATKGAVADLTGIGRILLVEDEDPVRLFGVRALRDKGYEVVEARNGEAAYDIISARQAADEPPFDLMITDVVMPVMDGPTLVKKVQELCPELKVIYISGYAEDSFRQKVGHDEGLHFLSKPFSLKDLAAKVKQVLGQRTIEGEQCSEDKVVSSHS